jgi:hypothetical protein
VGLAREQLATNGLGSGLLHQVELHHQEQSTVCAESVKLQSSDLSVTRTDPISLICMTPLFIMLARIVSVAFGSLLILLSVVLYETEEGTIQNKLEEWWVVLCDTESRAVKKHAAFVAGVAALAGRLFDRLFGQKFFTLRSFGVSACFSLASLGLVCARGLSGLLAELPTSLYVSVVILLLVMGVAPAALGRRWYELRLFRALWLVGVVILIFVSFVGMDVVNWFDIPIQTRLTDTGWEIGPPDSVEAAYYLIFVVVTIVSDALFIAATRWLLRISSRLNSRIKILGLMLGNVSLACLLVVVPVSLAWGVKAVPNIIRSDSIFEAVNQYAGVSRPNASFLATLAASNMLDGIVACTFFILLFVLLLHRMVWPTVQRPVYALAARGIASRRKFFLVLGVALVGLGGIPASAVSLIKELLAR